VDDHMLFAEALQVAIEHLGVSVTRVVTTGEEAIAEVDRERPDVIFMDIGLPDQSGLVAGSRILERHPEAKIVALTALSDRGTADEALRIGFVGYLTKDTPVARLANAIRSVMEGRLVLPQRLSPTRRISKAEKEIALIASQLTPREREVLTLLVQGVDGNRTAAALGISFNTVRTHLQSIFTKLQVHSRLQAAAFAVRHGIVQISRPEGDGDVGSHRS